MTKFRGLDFRGGRLVLGIGIFFFALAGGAGVFAFIAGEAAFAAVGIPLTILGLSMFIVGKLRLNRKREYLRRRAAYPSEHWRWDHPWDPAGITESGSFTWRGWLVGFIFSISLVLTFAQAVKVSRVFGARGETESMGIGGWLVLGTFVAIVFSVFIKITLRVFRRRKYGDSRLSFARFPFFLGSQFEARLENFFRFRSARKVIATLRCFEELDPPGKKYKERKEAFAVTQEIELSGKSTDDYLPITFSLPDDHSLGTDLAAPTPKYWELVLEIPMQGLDYVAEFLVPVYSKKPPLGFTE